MIIRAHEFPSVGTWYLDLDKVDMNRAAEFEIVAIDKEGNIEIQYFDGQIEELDKDTWFTNTRITAINPPSDWTGPFELESDIFHEINNDIQHPEDGHNPLDEIE